VRAIGRFMELGHLHLFGVKRTLRDAVSLKNPSVRVAGGNANSERISALGAVPIAIPPSDLRRYLEGALVGATLSSYETVKSGGDAAERAQAPNRRLRIGARLARGGEHPESWSLKRGLSRARSCDSRTPSCPPS
jgi:hypothetical protein